MPVYEYQCLSCGTSFELLQGISAEKTSSCPKCGDTVERVLSAGTGFILKNSNNPSYHRGRGRDANCQRISPCCGRDTRCDRPPCEN